MYLAVMVGKSVKQVVREWCPSQCCAVPFAFTTTSVHHHTLRVVTLMIVVMSMTRAL